MFHLSLSLDKQIQAQIVVSFVTSVVECKSYNPETVKDIWVSWNDSSLVFSYISSTGAYRSKMSTTSQHPVTCISILNTFSIHLQTHQNYNTSFQNMTSCWCTIHYIQQGGAARNGCNFLQEKCGWKWWGTNVYHHPTPDINCYEMLSIKSLPCTISYIKCNSIWFYFLLLVWFNVHNII